jgi:tRNA threonylcarbamoyladenosine biosynthesis protein TsaE
MQVALVGGLGAGKTTFSVAVGEALEVDEPLTSPTFALMVEHEGEFPVLHADLYRLGMGELEGIGFQERVDAWNGLVLVEWADRFPGCLQEDHLEIRLFTNADQRELWMSAHGKRSSELLLAWKAIVEAQ